MIYALACLLVALGTLIFQRQADQGGWGKLLAVFRVTLFIFGVVDLILALILKR